MTGTGYDVTSFFFCATPPEVGNFLSQAFPFAFFYLFILVFVFQLRKKN